MDPRTKQALFWIQTLTRLKKAGMLRNPTAAKLLAVAQSQRNPRELLSRLEDALAISELFAGPFPKPSPDAAGPLALGIAENGQVIGIHPNECHVLIAGQTGAGKTTLLRLLVSQAAAQGHKFWLFVRAEDTRCLIDISPETLVVRFDDSVKLNPLNPSPLRQDEHANAFLDIFIQSQRLYDGTKNYLLEQLSELYRDFEASRALPGLHDLYQKLKDSKHSAFSRTERYRESALNRFGGLLSGSLGEVFDCSRGIETALANTNCIFEIGSLTAEQQVFVVNLLLTRLFQQRLARPGDDWLIAGADDGNLLFDMSFEKRPDLGLPILHHLLSTVRKSKINVLCCTQAPHQIGAGIHSNSAIKVMFSLANGQDIEQMQRSVGNLSKEQKEACYKLAPRQFIVKNSYRYPEPLLASLPEIPEARAVGDAEIRASNAAILARLPQALPRQPLSQPNTPQEANERRKPPPSQPQSPRASDRLKPFLMAVYNGQYRCTLTEVCGNAGLSAGTGSRIAEECVKKLFIELIRLPFGKGRPKYPVLLPDGYKVLGMEQSRSRPVHGRGAGNAHTLYQHLIARHFAAYSPVIEMNRNGTFIDVGLSVNKRLVAVEVAMTAANEQSNIQKDLEIARVHSVVVACLDETTLQKAAALVAELDGSLKNKTILCLLSELLSTSPVDFLRSLPLFHS